MSFWLQRIITLLLTFCNKYTEIMPVRYNKAKFRMMEVKFRQLQQDLPLIAGREAVNFSRQSFRQQGWNGETLIPFKRKPSKKNRGRAILVKSSKLRNSVRIIAVGSNYVIIGSDLPYAQAHNQGFRGTVIVREFNRVSTRRFKTGKAKGNSKKKTGKGIKVRGAEGKVKQHSRKMNIPKNQFMGYSPYLIQRINRMISFRVRQII